MWRNRSAEMLTPVYDSEMALQRASFPALVISPATLPADDLTVQVHHDDGHWHRRAIGGLSTGCGKTLSRPNGGPGLGGNAQRFETYLAHEGPLCTDGCFSPWELEESKRLTADHQLVEERRQALLREEWEADKEERRKLRLTLPAPPVPGDDGASE